MVTYNTTIVNHLFLLPVSLLSMGMTDGFLVKKFAFICTMFVKILDNVIFAMSFTQNVAITLRTFGVVLN